MFSGVTHALDLGRLDVVIFHPPGHRRPSRFIRMSIWLEQQNITRNKRRYDVAKGCATIGLSGSMISSDFIEGGSLVVG